MGGPCHWAFCGAFRGMIPGMNDDSACFLLFLYALYLLFPPSDGKDFMASPEVVTLLVLRLLHIRRMVGMLGADQEPYFLVCFGVPETYQCPTANARSSWLTFLLHRICVISDKPACSSSFERLSIP